MKDNSFWQPHIGAVSLTFDDGTPNQLEEALPLLDRFGIKGTFYLSPPSDWRLSSRQAWMDVAASGHEIGNHSLSHWCPANVGCDTDLLEDKSIQDIENDILAAQEQLEIIAPHQHAWTYAYPCYQTFVGRGTSRQSYVPTVAKHFLAGRSLGEYGFANHPELVDLACLWASNVERMSGYEMIGLVEELTAKGQWLILAFHEINGSRLTVGEHEFQMLLSYLNRRSADIWTAPVVEVAKQIREVREERQG